MTAYKLLTWATVWVYGAAAAAACLALWKSRIPARWRRAALAFMIACASGIGAATLLRNPASRPLMVLAFLSLTQSAGMAWGAFAFRSEVADVNRVREVARKAESIRATYADSVPGVVATLATDGTVRHMNRYGLELLGMTEEEVVGRDAFELWGTEDARTHGRSEFETLCRSAGQAGGVVEYQVRTAKGDRVMRWTRSVRLNELGEVYEVISHGEDVTEQRKTEESLRAESYLLDSVHDSVIVTTLDGRFLYLNQAAHSMRGYSREEFLALEPFGWIAPESMADVLLNQRRVAENGAARYEALNVTKEGWRLPVEVHSQLVTFHGAPAIMNVSRDISERKHAEELVSQLAYTDPLTGLPNRRMVSQRLKEALGGLERGEVSGVAVIYIDVDNLKAVNDTAGHDTGDQLIKVMADRLSWVTRDDDILGRVGGDEFVLVIPDLVAEAHAEDIARRLLEFGSESVEIRGVTVRPSVSVGINMCTPGLTASEALKRADRAMYVAKKAGGNRAEFYDASMEAAISERFRLRSELAGALEAGELRLEYQVIADARSGAIAGAEALVRWRHSTRGLLLPGDFIEVAEESSLIVPIGRWVLMEACRALAEWRRQGLMVPRVSVNVSAVQLIDGDIIGDVAQAVSAAGLAPEDLELEITETAAMGHVDLFFPVFRRLQGMGVGLALDDFGTGHSSLERLQELPITRLKIARSFVSDLCSESESHPIIDTILVLCDRLSLRAVAEGVERPCHLDYLRRAGCDEVQGYLLGAPRGADEVAQQITADGRVTVRSTAPCHRGATCKLHRLENAPSLTPGAPSQTEDFDRLCVMLESEVERQARMSD